MLETTDPPGVEQKSVGRWEKVREFARELVSRKTIIVAIYGLQLVVRIVTLIKEMFDDF